MHQKCGVHETVEFKEQGGAGQRRKKRMQEKKGFDSIIFLVPFDLPFLSNAVLKKSIDETKKHRARKTFRSVSRYFF